MLRTLDVGAARQWAALMVRNLTAERAAIDRINVYPVADGDTGTNLMHTVRAGWQAVRTGSPDTLGELLAALAKGAVNGARGNSGVLLAQVLRGIAEAVDDTLDGADVDGTRLRAALRNADRAAGRAVVEPVSGTLLSVLRAAVEATERSTDDLAAVVRNATVAATEALANTPGQLATLGHAGVVDAGGRGLVVVLDTLHAVICEGQRLAPDPPGPPSSTLVAPETAELEHASSYAYEVMYLVADAGPNQVNRLRSALSGLGDCVSVAYDGTDGWVVHVHCDDIGAAIEAGIETGRVHRISVTRFADQSAADEVPAGERGTTDRAVLACVASSAVGDLFIAEGAHTLRVGAETGVDELCDAIRNTWAAHVVVLPNGEAVSAAAELAAQRAVFEGQDVIVVPSVSPVQGLAAVAVHDPTRRRAEDQVAMAEAAAATRRGELRVAESEALTWVGRCAPGDVLGLVDGEVVLIGADLSGAARDLLDRLLATGGELVTAILDRSVLATELADYLRRAHPEVDLETYQANDLEAVLLLGIE